ncbi:CBS domain-containing protein [Bacillus cihuensis]|uniref:hypothetical protein n=1 Tax=Bacillus cihuensis TaxID=1208599 RepID=UPI0004163234|nr:hypothetical protein [Bacillus cihuensis]
MKEVTVDKLVFKENLSIIEQMSLKDIMYKWLGSPEEGLDNILPLEYTHSVFAKMETPPETNLMIESGETFRYVTLTEDNQIIIGVLDINNELRFRIFYLEERLGV